VDPFFERAGGRHTIPLLRSLPSDVCLPTGNHLLKQVSSF
jgi:hypothetical protein